MSLILSFSASYADSMLRIRPHIVVSPGSEVKLSQLVDAQDLAPDLIAKMNAISLTQAPAYGEQVELANASLTSILRPLVQAERERGHALHLVIPHTVVVDTTKHDLEAGLVKTEMLQAWSPLCADCRLEIEGLSLPRVDHIRDWNLRLKGELPHGGFSVPVEIVRENGAPTSAWVSGRLIVKRKVPVAQRVIAINERVSAADFAWEFRDTSYSIDGIPSAEDLIGKRLKQGLRATEVLWKGMLEKERAIRAGELVQLKSSESGWEITMSMVAQQDAFVGDVINLKNPKTNNVLMGMVTGRGEVELR